MIPANLLTSRHLCARPELATLAVLSAALDAADAALWHQHPEHDWDPDRPGPHHATAEPCHIANSILVLTGELQFEIDRYWEAAGGNQLGLPYDPAIKPTSPYDPDPRKSLPF